MIALGFDPGFGLRNCTGWALVDTGEQKVLARGTVKATGDGDDKRVGSLVGQVMDVCQKAPRITNLASGQDVTVLCAYELPFRGPNQRTVAGLARVCGVIHTCAVQCGMVVVSVQPAEAKIALTGYGAADKRQMVAAARMQFGLEGQLTDAEADAIGIALAGAAKAMEF